LGMVLMLMLLEIRERSMVTATLGGTPVMAAAALPLAIIALVGPPTVGLPIIGPPILLRLVGELTQLRFVPQLRVALTGGSGALHSQVSHQGIQGCRSVRRVRGAGLCVVVGAVVLRGTIKYSRKVGSEAWSRRWLTGFVLDGGSRLLWGRKRQH
jgi:hypothetical protein